MTIFNANKTQNTIYMYIFLLKVVHFLTESLLYRMYIKINKIKGTKQIKWCDIAKEWTLCLRKINSSQRKFCMVTYPEVWKKVFTVSGSPNNVSSISIPFQWVIMAILVCSLWLEIMISDSFSNESKPEIHFFAIKTPIFFIYLIQKVHSRPNFTAKIYRMGQQFISVTGSVDLTFPNSR